MWTRLPQEGGDLAASKERVGTRSAHHPRLPQRLTTNDRAPQQEERLVDVGPLVIPDAETAKLIEPRKRPLHDPPPPAQTAPVRGATHGGPRYDIAVPSVSVESPPRRSRDPPSTESGRCRGRPRSPWSGGIASTNARASSESFRFAPVKRTASGTPCPSQIR
jgi:hypothetical protein